ISYLVTLCVFCYTQYLCRYIFLRMHVLNTYVNKYIIRNINSSVCIMQNFVMQNRLTPLLLFILLKLIFYGYSYNIWLYMLECAIYVTQSMNLIYANVI